MIELLAELRDELGLSYIFIAHDLPVVRDIADRVAVMQRGRIVETGLCDEIFDRPQHPYTQALLAAVPRVDAASRPARLPLTGDLPSPLRPPHGCRFHTRCPKAMPVCREQAPTVRDVAAGHSVACHLYPELRA